MTSNSFVLDTNVIIDLINKKNVSLPKGERFFSVITENEAVRIRRFGSPHLKLPDAIIAASAVVLDATLVTNDETMLRLEWPGFAACNAR